ncbi:Signal transduction response regulator, receiver domain [Sesbania bispinosa]|nr:Signal transduction response regulator, receiver domain [Sesbania bispinosa]
MPKRSVAQTCNASRDLGQSILQVCILNEAATYYSNLHIREGGSENGPGKEVEYTMDQELDLGPRIPNVGRMYSRTKSGLLGVSGLSNGGCSPKFIIIDDGWQEMVNKFCEEARVLRMGEVAAGVMQRHEEEQSNHNNRNASEEEVVVRWERFLPRMVLRVLLVEADDSTRQIIAALLRKCSYRVAAVRDGLKAWETLKNKASDIDLILTEVELPSISGFSLLTLIMEHDICKNIPVIMMSSRDSVSMVFKCMSKGAADFLIKPVRRNELRNLWQHVWRRHAISRPPQDLTFPQNKLNVAAENNATSNNSTRSVASTQKNNEYNEKTSEAQSTCTSPFLEAETESAYMENMQDTSQLKCTSNLSNIDMVKHEKSTKFERESAEHNDEAEDKSIIFVSEAAMYNKTLTGLRLGQGYDCSRTENQDEVVRAELSKAHHHIHGCSDEPVKPSTGAIDLIATFENLPKSAEENCSFNIGNTAKFGFDTQLELSLKRDSPGSSCKPATEERQILNHSNASAFSRYSSSKLLQPLFPAQDSNEQHKLSEDTNTSHQYDCKNQNQENITTLAIGQSGQAEAKLPNSQLGFFPGIGVTSDNKSTGNRHGNLFPSMLSTQSGKHPIWTPKPVCHKESSPFPTSTSSQSNTESHNSEHHHWSDDATYTSDQHVDDQRNLDCGMHDSPATGQNPGSSFYHDAANHNSSGVYGSVGSGSDGNAPSAVEAQNNLDSFMDSGHHTCDGFKGTDSHGTSQRQAALTKFRLKRKDRCYEKKVRYESRKRLAEQRPRVKGQFVRQVHNEQAVADAGGGF